MPAGRPSTYKPEYCDAVIQYGKQGKSQVQIAVALGIPRSTMHSWAEQHEEFSAALTRAKECEQDWWENAGQTGLTADKFNSAVWSKSMSARFRDDYTDRVQQEHSGQVDTTDPDVRQLSRAILSVLGQAVPEDAEEPS